MGRSDPWLELEVFDTGLDRYERGFAEGLDVLLAALSRSRVAATGQFFRFREVAVVPDEAAPASRDGGHLAGQGGACRALGLPVLLGRTPMTTASGT